MLLLSVMPTTTGRRSRGEEPGVTTIGDNVSISHFYAAELIQTAGGSWLHYPAGAT
jgi:hypothetical protein